jgi:transcriptional activator of cad operon
MKLLVCLAERAGEVVSIDELLDRVWSGVVVTPDSVYQAVASLRRLLGDDPKRSSYIATVPRLGYRMVATVAPWSDPRIAAASSSQNSRLTAAAAGAAVAARNPRRRFANLFGAGIALLLVLVAALILHNKLASNDQTVKATAASPPQKSVGVLPFLDLTEGMKEEYFADGMTEELIHRLSKVAGLRVPAPTTSFYFKGKQMTVGEIGKALGVTYVLDGSVRKSGATLRVAARLLRADDGFVIWSETYDRHTGDILKIQDDIAGEVTRALQGVRD